MPPFTTPPEVDGEIARLDAEIERLRGQRGHLQGTYSRARGWSRFYLVQDGHLHRSTDCSTCYPTTQFYWLTELSGLSDAEIVERAGERACAVCFPDAPVETLRRKSVLFTPDEIAKRDAQNAKEDKRAAAQAATVTVPDLWEHSFMDRTKRREVTFKTERGAALRAQSNLKSAHWYRLDNPADGHPSEAEWLHDARQIITVLAERQGVDPDALYAELDAKAAKASAAEYRKATR